VSADDFADSTVLLIAHGSTVNVDSAVCALQHAAELETTQRFAAVNVGFWKQPPFLRDALNKISTRRIFAVPLFLSDGYFTRQILPQELGLALTGEGERRIKTLGLQMLFYCEPIGTSDVMTDVILARIGDVLRQTGEAIPDSHIAITLAAHGTERDPNSGRAADWHVRRIRAMNRFAEVHAAFLEESPRISELPTLVRAKHVVVVPFFISEGLHAREDVPVLLGELQDVVRQRIQAGQPTFINPTERYGKRICYAASVGTAPQVRDVILQRVREAARWSA
jgi:sirohydrochlorin cobaltochelatase